MGLEEKILKASSVLGLRNKASIQEIKDHFTRRAKELHPDCNHGNQDFNSLFIELREAYDLLIEYAFSFPLPLGGDELKKHIAKMDYQDRVKKQYMDGWWGDL